MSKFSTFMQDLRGPLAVAGVGYSLFAVATGLDSLNGLALPKDPEPIVKKVDRMPEVGEVLTVHGATIRGRPSLAGVRGGVPVGTISVRMEFTDGEGRRISGELNRTHFPGQPFPNLDSFDGFKVEGTRVKVLSMSESGVLRLGAVES